MKANGNAIALYGNGAHPDEINATHYLKMENPSVSEIPKYDQEKKIQKISEHFKQIMILLGLDLSDDSLMGTPERVAKMYVNEMNMIIISFASKTKKFYFTR